ncbi:pilus assembly protein TadG-related protein [Streptomyces sp. A5-4]|uniref:pilus assembly protein TadG-related protein n=1 Tax=Streptomyces sp. A5-4 TaxID=3384771 RepID=UPI003DA8B4AE
MRQDRGQTLPMYVVVVAGLLFLAFAYFAFAQAAAARNSGQSAADAAALAAAQDGREVLTEGFFESLEVPEEWPAWLAGERDPGAGYGAAASQLAGANDADVASQGMTPSDGGYEFSVAVVTRGTVGDSVIPGTESTHAKADATAAIESLCVVAPEGEEADLIEIDCRGSGRWQIDPDTPVDEQDDLPEPKDLFSVHLVE